MAFYKKIICSLLFLLAFSNSHAKHKGNDAVELKAGLFAPVNNYTSRFPEALAGQNMDYLNLGLAYSRYIKKDLTLDFNVAAGGLAAPKNSDDDISLTLIPISLSVGKILGIIRSVQYKVAAGLDVLLVDGEINKSTYNDRLGGYHIKMGIRYFHFMAEVKYSVIDLFSQNDSDANMGGWTLNAGLVFQFYLF